MDILGGLSDMGGMYYCVIDLSFILIFPNCFFFPNLFLLICLQLVNGIYITDE